MNSSWTLQVFLGSMLLCRGLSPKFCCSNQTWIITGSDRMFILKALFCQSFQGCNHVKLIIILKIILIILIDQPTRPMVSSSLSWLITLIIRVCGRNIELVSKGYESTKRTGWLFDALPLTLVQSFLPKLQHGQRRFHHGTLHPRCAREAAWWSSSPWSGIGG